MGQEYSSAAIAEEMERVFGARCKVVKIDILYKDEINKYLMKIEEAHRMAADSTLVFGGNPLWN